MRRFLTTFAVLVASACGGPDPVSKTDSDTSNAGIDAEHANDMGMEASACVRSEPQSVEFDAIEAGTTSTQQVVFTNCGSEPLEIEDVRVKDGAAPFALDMQSIGDLDLLAGESYTVDLTFNPQMGGEFSTWLVVEAAGEFFNTRLSGRAAAPVDDPCPRPIVTVEGIDADADVADYRTTRGERATFDASESEFRGGTIASYDWTIETPVGSAENRDEVITEVSFDVAGTYTVSLDLRGDGGELACEVWSATVVVNETDDDLVIQLTWQNDEDPDPSDDEGSDLDLHLVKMGPGQWFESPYDVFFRNPNNMGGDGNLWDPENPSLTLDARDGGGPEVIVMPEADDCEWYAVGVHYYRQLYGVAEFDLRVFTNGGLVFELTDQRLERGGEFADVARIHWPSRTIWPVGVLLNEAPASVAPAVTNDMATSGLCTDQMLY